MARVKVRTTVAKTGQVDQKWYHVDATDQILGRLAARLATVLMGKHKPIYTRHVDCGDFVIVTNCEKIRVTGRKAETITYPHYSYYPGGYREEPYQRVLERHPDRIIRESVRRMLPKSSLGHQMLRKLKVYAGEAHPHHAQQPKAWTF
ncbi:MAG: 50S ribosomal protein L13 [Planctomycetes bacterium]|nr:50S ribosomal protein L13 [Planctomycetota bacterium]